MDRLTKYAWLVLGWNLVTILGGAVVRATGSGAGCGRSWPTCQGEMMPELAGATAVEFVHRGISGVALGLVVGLWWWIRKDPTTGRRVRRMAMLGVVAIIGEALIGALIVFSEWVADDASLARVVAVPLHLVNTLLLLAALTLTIVTLGEPRPGPGRVPAVFVWGGVGMVMLAATGAVTALADTLFPKDGFVLSGIMSVETGEHFLTRLRIIHPALSVMIGLLVGWAGWRYRSHGWAGRVVVGAVVGQMILGAVNVLTGTPLAVSLLHLLVADLLWIAWIWLAANSPAGRGVAEQSDGYPVGQRLPGGLDDVLVNPDGSPRSVVVGGLQKNPDLGGGAVGGVEHPHPVVGET